MATDSNNGTVEASYTVQRSFRRSDTCAALFAALCKAQKAIKGAVKDSANPFFHSKYADLASVRDACFGPLTDNGLCVLQFPRLTTGGVEVETVLAHNTGEWVSETLELPVMKNDAQGVGSAITYARRYALAAIAGVCPEDDDGNAAAKGVADLREQALKSLRTATSGGSAALEKAWKALSPDARKSCAKDLEGLKAAAGEHNGN